MHGHVFSPCIQKAVSDFATGLQPGDEYTIQCEKSGYSKNIAGGFAVLSGCLCSDPAMLNRLTILVVDLNMANEAIFHQLSYRVIIDDGRDGLWATCVMYLEKYVATERSAEKRCNDDELARAFAILATHLLCITGLSQASREKCRCEDGGADAVFLGTSL
jgi:hypothetical protein